MRRRFARRMGRPMRGILGAVIPPLLVRANQLFASGDFAGAADGLEALAQRAEGRGGRRAAMLYLEAGRARLLSGQIPAAMQLLDRGLRLLGDSGAALRLARAGRRVIAELTGRGLTTEAEQIRRSLEALGAAPLDGLGNDEPRGARPALPTHCPGCGAPVHPGEVEWLDDVTAECGYCGTPMRPG